LITKSFLTFSRRAFTKLIQTDKCRTGRIPERALTVRSPVGRKDFFKSDIFFCHPYRNLVPRIIHRLEIGLTIRKYEPLYEFPETRSLMVCLNPDVLLSV
jgi:hypothetical protein